MNNRLIQAWHNYRYRLPETVTMKVAYWGGMVCKQKESNDDFCTRVSSVDEALDAVIQGDTNVLVIDSEMDALYKLFAKLNKLPQKVHLVLISPELPYFIVADNTMNSAVNCFVNIDCQG